MWSSCPAISAAGPLKVMVPRSITYTRSATRKRLSDVLFDEEDSDAFVGRVADAGEESVDDERREPEGQLVGEQHPRVATEGSGQREHLLLAARHEPGGSFEECRSSSGNSATASSLATPPRRRLSAALMFMMMERSSVR